MPKRNASIMIHDGSIDSSQAMMEPIESPVSGKAADDHSIQIT